MDIRLAPHPDSLMFQKKCSLPFSLFENDQEVSPGGDMKLDVLQYVKEYYKEEKEKLYCDEDLNFIVTKIPKIEVENVEWIPLEYEEDMVDSCIQQEQESVQK